MNITERDRLASALIALRPDWGNTGTDKIKRVRTWLTENAMDWAYLDAVVSMTVCAVDEKTDTPGRVLLDGPWRTILRHLTGATGNEQPPRDVGPECATCGVEREYHAGVRATLEHGPHEFVPAAPRRLASPQAIANARRIAFSTEGDR